MPHPSIRIFVVYHKPMPLMDRAPFEPIQVGGAPAIPGVACRDDTGDNIALKNPHYCELTAQYWIWKNVKADYVGLCHYRRIPSFSGCRDQTFGDFSDATCGKFGWTQERIGRLLAKYDILLPPCWDVFPPGEPGNLMTPYAFHAREHRESDLAEAIRVIHEVSPEMDGYARRALREDHAECFGNVCVMRGDLFNAYSQWLFDVLFALEKRVVPPANHEQARLFGFLSERLIMVWLRYAQDRLGARVWFAKMLPLGRFPDHDADVKILAKERPSVAAPILSVIIPVYNVETYLRRCLNSVCGQCEERIEVICVNDGSTDGSGAILAAFAAKDHRIRVVDQPNQGQGAARNRGLELARGKYVAFVDSDDWVDPHIWSRAVRKAEREDLDMVLFDVQDVEDGTERFLDVPWSRFRLPEACYRRPFTWREFGRSPFDTCCYPYNRVIRRDFLQGIAFPTGVLYEDAVWHYRLLFSARRIGAFAISYYYYRRRRNSTMGIRDDRVLDHLRIIDGVAALLVDKGLFAELQGRFLDYAALLLRQTYRMLPTDHCFQALCDWISREPQSRWDWEKGARRTAWLWRQLRSRRFRGFRAGLAAERLFRAAAVCRTPFLKIFRRFVRYSRKVLRRSSAAPDA